MPRQPAARLERWLLPLLHSLRREYGSSHALTATPSLLPRPRCWIPAASNSLAAAFPISLPTFITLLVALRAAALAALAALISDCSCRLTTSAATSPFSFFLCCLRRHSSRG